MKKIVAIACCLATLVAATDLAAQNTTKKSVPLSIFVPEQAEYVPTIAQEAMANKLRQIVNINGMGATDDVGQFVVTCTLSVTDKQIVSGAPMKIAQKMDATFYIGDNFGKKVFGTTTISVRGVGDNENKAYISALKQIMPAQPQLKTFIENTNTKIINYYNEQCDNIIKQARTLALAKQYEAAFFQLSLIPEACEESYAKVLVVANDIFQKYIDDKAAACLAKAKSIWNAGQDREAAEAAGEYLAQILPDATCYAQAEALAKEIKSKIKDDLAFERAMYKTQLEWQHQENTATIKAWRDVGVAYGNGQKQTTYNPVWLVR
ncbi:MAG: hypothetical protein RSB23_05405 [Alistipes sp.]